MHISSSSSSSLLNTRVRTILVLGYWVLSNIHRYWIVLLLGDIFCCSDTQYNTNQRAVSTVHMPVNDYLVPLLTGILTDAIVCLVTMMICCCLLNTIIVIIEFWDFFCGRCYAMHQYQYWYWVLVSLEANTIGYWILGAFLGIVLTLLTTTALWTLRYSSVHVNISHSTSAVSSAKTSRTVNIHHVHAVLKSLHLKVHHTPQKYKKIHGKCTTL